jgi:AcrR family transcriptional regulator
MQASTERDKDTKTAILDSAERLFSQHGVQGVSVRRVLAEAGVNVALAHYHFGDRDGLIREVLRRRVEPVNEKRLALLDQVESAAGPNGPALDAVLRAFFGPIVDLLDRHPDFARLIGQLHVAADPKMKQFFLTLFGAVIRRFAAAVRGALPAELGGPERACRTLFTFGAMIHTLTNQADMELMARGRFEAPRGELLLQELVAFCAAGLTAPTSVAGSGGTR